MNPVPINYLAIVVAAIASMVIGYLWYGPIFGKPWMKLMGMSSAQMSAEKKKGMAKGYIIMYITSAIMAYVLAHALVFGNAYLHASGIMSGIMVGFWNWLGFIATVTVGSVLWEGKSWKLWFLNNGFWLVNLCIMGIILELWK